MTDYDPDQVPVSDAATVMLIADRPRLSVLMLRRTAKVAFASDMWVFPGGRVDPNDSSDLLPKVTSGLTDAQASTALGVNSGGLAWWVAVCRETLEESGVLLTTRPAGPELVKHLTERVREQEGSFIDLLIEHSLVLDLGAIAEVAQMITPLGPPRRFDARFFVAKAPLAALPIQDDSEIVDWQWVEPSRALNQWRTGEKKMMSPTVLMLGCLDAFSSVEEVMEIAALGLPYKQLRIHDPEGEYRGVLPGDPDYEAADPETEFGQVRLWVPPR